MLDAFQIIASKEGVTPEEVYRAVQQSIDDAWKNPLFRLRIILLTHSLRKPNPDSFTLAAANHLNKKHIF